MNMQQSSLILQHRLWYHIFLGVWYKFAVQKHSYLECKYEDNNKLPYSVNVCTTLEILFSVGLVVHCQHVTINIRLHYNFDYVWLTLFIIDPHQMSCIDWVATRERFIVHLVLHDKSRETIIINNRYQLNRRIYSNMWCCYCGSNDSSTNTFLSLMFVIVVHVNCDECQLMWVNKLARKINV